MTRRQGILGLLATLAAAEAPLLNGQEASWGELKSPKGPSTLTLSISPEWYDRLEIDYKGRKASVSFDEILDALAPAPKAQRIIE